MGGFANHTISSADRDDAYIDGELETCRTCGGDGLEPETIYPCMKCNGTGQRKYRRTIEQERASVEESRRAG